MNFALANASGKSVIQGKNILKNSSFSGKLNLDQFNLKDFLTSIGKPINTSDPNTLQKVAALTQFEMQNSALKLNQLHIKIDDANVLGNMIFQLKNKIGSFALATQYINLTPYIPNKSQKETNPKNSQSQIQKSHPSKQNSWAFNGTIRIGKLILNKLELTNLTSTISDKNDIIEISPIHAQLYQGNANGNIIVDQRDKQKTFITIKQLLSNINVQQMLHQLANSEKLSGTANISADLSAVTTPNTSFLAGLNGNLKLNIKNGALQGVDVFYQISKAHAFIKRLSRTDISDSKQTQFNELSGTATINKGVLTNNDLALSSEYLNVTGKGTINLITKNIRYYLKALAKPKLAQENDLGKDITSYEIPIKISGTLAKPSVNLDISELGKMILKQQIAKPIKENVEKNINKLKEKIKDKFNLNILNQL